MSTPRSMGSRGACVLLAAALLLGAHGAQAAALGTLAPEWVSVGVSSGTTLEDASLGLYQWDLRPHLAYGASAFAGRGRFALGARLWRSQTTQAIDPSVAISPQVRSTTFELTGRVRLAERFGVALDACGSAGRLHLGYAPDVLAIPIGGGSSVNVALSPITTWIGGGGVALRRGLLPHWDLEAQLERELFSLDTAHRAGAQEIDARQSFGDWSARLELARTFSLSVKGTSR
ncbi:MAG TPA: hypothetical protein VMH61_07035 [Candidatus Acidoferrales bacterium]|nr:hypothetical protein [Candidatus Acidoferrales bacterium]